MAFPQLFVYLYQEWNNREAPWRVALDIKELPHGTKVSKYKFESLLSVKIVATEEAQIEE